MRGDCRQRRRVPVGAECGRSPARLAPPLRQRSPGLPFGGRGRLLRLHQHRSHPSPHSLGGDLGRAGPSHGAAYGANSKPSGSCPGQKLDFEQFKLDHGAQIEDYFKNNYSVVRQKDASEFARQLREDLNYRDCLRPIPRNERSRLLHALRQKDTQRIVGELASIFWECEADIRKSRSSRCPKLTRP